MQAIANQVVGVAAPMLGAMLVVVLVFALLMAKVRNRAVRQLGGYAAAIVWLGWMASYYKVV